MGTRLSREAFQGRCLYFIVCFDSADSSKLLFIPFCKIDDRLRYITFLHKSAEPDITKLIMAKDLKVETSAGCSLLLTRSINPNSGSIELKKSPWLRFERFPLLLKLAAAETLIRETDRRMIDPEVVSV